MKSEMLMNEFNDKNGNIVEITSDFDFTNETVNYIKLTKLKKEIFDYSDENIDVMKKYLMYKMNFESQDPDLKSYLLQEIYKDKWDEKYLKTCLRNKNSVYSDAMTSAQTLLNKFYETVCSEEWEKYKKKNTKIKYCSKSAMNEIFNAKEKEFPMFEKYFKNDTEVTRFIHMYHTIGNYIPVPMNFNASRSGEFADHDMWDLTLVKIYEYYQNKERNVSFSEYDKTLMELVFVDNIVIPLKNWLESFKTWKKFIRENYLQDYVELQGDWPIRKDLTELHNWENSEPKDYLKYFKIITEIIEKRGERILFGNKVEIKDE